MALFEALDKNGEQITGRPFGVAVTDKEKKDEEEERRRQLLATAQRARAPGQYGGMMFPPMLGNNGQAIANATMSAIQDENDSRVAQMREMRRLAASQAEEQMKYDYLLKKLEMERDMMEKERKRQSLASGTWSRTFKDGDWVYS